MIRFVGVLGIFATSISFAASAASLQDIHYSITKDESKRDIKRVVEIVLPERVDQSTLEALAIQIKESNRTHYQRTFIGWRIKGEEGGAYWAKTDFVPELTVQFLGAREADYKKLKATQASAGKVIGSWMSSWGSDNKMVGYQKGGKTFIISTYTDGSSGTKEFVNKKVSGQPVLVDAEGSDFGEYFLINAHGDLEFWSENGKFYTAQKTD